MRGALSPGSQLLGQYQIEKVIGGGGFGLTYLGLDLRTMEYVCIKELFIHKQSVRNEDGSVLVATVEEDRQFFMERFIREASSLATFQHPHVVRVDNYFEAGGTAYYVMEYIEGETLSEHVRSQGGLDLGQLRHIFRQLMDAVEAIHDQDLLHRDIKPSNVMLEPGLRVKLIDFGAAKDPKIQAKSGHTVVITDGFAPLEQYSAEGNIGPHSDIYSLGATMLFALTGKRPVPATSRQETLEQAEDVAPKIREMLAYFMQARLEDRPVSMAAARAEFENALSAALSKARKRQDQEEDPVEFDEEAAGKEGLDGLDADAKSPLVSLSVGIAACVVGLLIVDALAIYLSLDTYDWILDWMDGGVVDADRAVELEKAGIRLDLIYALVSIPVALLFLRWLYRVYDRANAVVPVEYGRSQVFWSWVIPVLNWFRPYQIVKRCLVILLDSVALKKEMRVVRVWWTLWLLKAAGIFLIRLSISDLQKYGGTALQRKEFQEFYWGYMVVEIACTIVFVLMVYRLSLAMRDTRSPSMQLSGTP